MLHPAISIIVPVRNEPRSLLNNLEQLTELKGVVEVIVADSSDGFMSLEALESLQQNCKGLRVIHSSTSGRANQMNLAANHAKGDILWFIHADTHVPIDSVECIQQALDAGKRWGRFDVCFDSNTAKMRIVANAMNFRSAVSSICTGDQAIFIERSLFETINGFPKIAIMEDIEISKRLKSYHRAFRARIPVVTSARRWETEGYMNTVLNMWVMRFLHWIGISPDVLIRMYRQVR